MRDEPGAMFNLSRKALLAIEAIVDIAHHGRSDPVPSRDFAERLGIARRHLEPVLQALVRDGILKSIRGPRGGYVLARERRRITLGDIVRAAQGGQDGETAETSALARKVIMPVLGDAMSAATRALDDVTLMDLMARADAARLLPERATPEDFII